MGSFLDLTAQRFGRLTVLRLGPFQIDYPPSVPNGRKRYMWVCECDCGVTMTTSRDCLTSGSTQSCGCYHKEGLARRSATHGKSRTSEYTVWSEMRGRCYRSSHARYADYGGRGITMCDAWRESFEAFYRDMGLRPSAKHQIERRNNDGPYSPNNCEWATQMEQVNNRRVTIWIEANGERLLVSEWAAKTGIHAERIRERLRRGWTPAAAVLTPNAGRCRHMPRIEG